MDWELTDDLIAWGKQHFPQIAVEGVWAPPDLGVQYMRTDEDTFALIFMYDHPAAEEAHTRLSGLIEACGFKVEMPDGYQKVVPPLNPHEQAEMELVHRQETARGWLCDCNYPLANLMLEDKSDMYVETIEAEVDNGYTAPIEIWKSVIKCTNCGTDVEMEPEHFHLLAGTDIHMTWNVNKEMRLAAMTRMQIKEMADLNNRYVEDCEILGGNYEGHRVPPWMWGLMVRKHRRFSEEE
jgi:hypothetical protein